VPHRDRLPGLGYELRQRHQCGGCGHQAATRQDRRPIRAQSDTHRAQHWLHVFGTAMKRWTLRSLTVQTTLFFALISCLVVSALGLYLYSSAKHALEVRADYTLVGRVDRFRNLLHDLYNVRQMEERPAIF